MDRLFEQVIETVQAVQKKHSDKKGWQKKALVIKYMKSYHMQIKSVVSEDVYNMYADFINNYLDPLIDIIILVAKNKTMIKLFKKNCKCLFLRR
jgi:hypothetical protein